jgi:hypothetical protein
VHRREVLVAGPRLDIVHDPDHGDDGDRERDQQAARVQLGQIPPARVPFVDSLGVKYRAEIRRRREGKRVPKAVAFVTVITKRTTAGAIRS